MRRVGGGWVGELAALVVKLVEFLLGFLGDVFGTLADLKGAFGRRLAACLVAFGKIVAESFLVVAEERGELGMGVNGEDAEAIDDWLESGFLVSVIPLGDGLLQGESLALGDFVSFASDKGGQGEKLFELGKGFFGRTGANFKLLRVDRSRVGICEKVA